jgi:hypothetical protein
MRALGSCLVFILFASACATDDDSDDLDADPVPGTAQALEAATIRVMRGTDRASEFSVASAKDLKNNHGVKFTGVYIGGPCNGGSGWTKAGVTAISHATGWKFEPIYVGQQESAICGHHNLTYNQGKADGKAAVADMKRFGWEPKKDIPVSLDLEAGTYYAHPTSSTNYVRGWVNEVHALGYRAHVYSTPFGLNTFHDKHVKIDGAWAASYFYSGFKNVAPADLSQMGSRFRHKNRAWQYAGNFEVSGAGKVDADTANMLLAPKPGGTNRATTSHRVTPAACGVLQPTEGLARGESVASCDGSMTLTLGNDGVLVLDNNGTKLWTTPTDGLGETAVLEDNGELAVFDADGEPIYNAGTFGHPDAQLELQATGLALVDDDSSAIWTSSGGMLESDDTPVGDDADDDSMAD